MPERDVKKQTRRKEENVGARCEEEIDQKKGRECQSEM